jgi:phenylalanyl-tRNA synthetase beta chain
MRVSLGWLREWIDLPDSRRVLEDQLTLGGLEIEDVITTGPSLEGVIVGHVVTREQHPNADRLAFCRVDVGGSEPLEIVCGAPNVAAGQRVAVALAGTVLPDGTRLARTKLRGVVSHGMICSERELGLGEGSEGILVLDPSAAPGTPVASLVSTGDVILDVKITPNRGDWASMLGFAREVRAHFGGELRMPPHDVAESGPAASGAARVDIEDPGGCSRYVARVVRGVDATRPSPEWVVRKLEAAGLRSISVVVDVTNLVMLELGQPLHAFDLATLRGARIRVRRATEGEKLLTLDGATRELSATDLVIADAERAIAIAGVMGGAETEVRPDTRDVLLESAEFAPSRVRATARRLGLHSEASYRFERGIDPEGVARAADRACYLLCELAGGTCAPGRVEAWGTAPARVSEISLDPLRVNRLLGTHLSAEQIASLLARLEIACAPVEGGRLSCSVPSYRSDLAIQEDLVEEVARLYGYDTLPTTLPAATLAHVPRHPKIALEDRVRDVLAALGLCEVIHFPAMQPGERAAMRMPEPPGGPVRLANPMNERESELRDTVLPGLLRAVSRNLARQVDAVALFELGPVFRAAPGAELPDERVSLAAAITEETLKTLWEPARAPVFFRARGVADGLFQALRLTASWVPTAEVPYLHPARALEIQCAGARLGVLGELHPEVARAFEMDVPVAVLELALDALQRGLAAAPPASLRPVSRYPAVRRDLAVVLPLDARAAEVADAIRKTGGGIVRDVEIFDRFLGAGVPEGKVSVAYRIVFQSVDRTLTDAEVTKATERIRTMLERRFGGELR